jgi:hypothetical protein
VDDTTTYDDVTAAIEKMSGVPAAEQAVYLTETLIEPGHDLAE